MVLFRVASLIALAAAASLIPIDAQVSEAAGAGEKRVKISQNNDGSRTTYEVDTEARKAIATTTGADGKVQSTIRYDLDDAGRYERGEVFGRTGEFLMKTSYKYDAAGRLQEESQFAKDGALRNKLVYSYDQLTGRQSGYAIYDAAGKLVNQTRANSPARGAAASVRATPAPKRSGR